MGCYDSPPPFPLRLGCPSPPRYHRLCRWRRQGHWDRAGARAPLDGGFPASPFRLRGGFTVPSWVTFPRAPRFIPDGRISRVRLATLAAVRHGPFPVTPKLKLWPAYAPDVAGLIHDSTPLPENTNWWALRPSPLPVTAPTKRREPLCPFEVLPLQGCPRRPPRRALPLLRRSYGLMCRSPNPPFGFASTIPRGLCRLLPAPAGSGTFPTLSLRVFPWMLGPVSRWLALVRKAVSSQRNIGLPRLGLGSACQNAPLSNVTVAQYFGTAVICLCSGLQVCLPPRLLPPLWGAPQGGRGVYVRAERMSLPSCASDMLAARIGQLAAGDLHPTRLAALSAAPPRFLGNPDVPLPRSRTPAGSIRLAFGDACRCGE
jgi:hypothetical protein